MPPNASQCKMQFPPSPRIASNFPGNFSHAASAKSAKATFRYCFLLLFTNLLPHSWASTPGFIPEKPILGFISPLSVCQRIFIWHVKFTFAPHLLASHTYIFPLLPRIRFIIFRLAAKLSSLFAAWKCCSNAISQLQLHFHSMLQENGKRCALCEIFPAWHLRFSAHFVLYWTVCHMTFSILRAVRQLQAKYIRTCEYSGNRLEKLLRSMREFHKWN